MSHTRTLMHSVFCTLAHFSGCKLIRIKPVETCQAQRLFFMSNFIWLSICFWISRKALCLHVVSYRGATESTARHTCSSYKSLGLSPEFFTTTIFLSMDPYSMVFVFSQMRYYTAIMVSWCLGEQWQWPSFVNVLAHLYFSASTFHRAAFVQIVWV